MNSKAIRFAREVKSHSALKRPIVWIFSGLSAECVKLDLSLFALSTFQSSIQRAQQLLIRKGIDLISNLISGDNDNNTTIINVTVIQIALVDTLKSLDIHPDYLVAHSIGQLACGYGDGSLTAEQAILCAHAVAEIVTKSKLKANPLVKVKLGYRKLCSIKPDEIEIVHHNGSDLCTITGPVYTMAAFISDMQNRNIPILNLSKLDSVYHSEQAVSLESELLKRFQKTIPGSLHRSEKWLAHSDLHKLQYCSSDYLTKSFFSTEFLEDTLVSLSHKVVTIEIAAHEQLQSSLIVAIPNGVHVDLSTRHSENNLDYFLRALGR